MKGDKTSKGWVFWIFSALCSRALFERRSLYGGLFGPIFGEIPPVVLQKIQRLCGQQRKSPTNELCSRRR